MKTLRVDEGTITVKLDASDFHREAGKVIAEMNFMPIPRCDTCVFWNSYKCSSLKIATSADFGCVCWGHKA